MPTSVQLIGRGLASGVAVVSTIVSAPQGPAALLRVLGWDTPPGAPDIGLANFSAGDLADKLASLNIAASGSAGSGGVSLDIHYAEVFTSLTNALTSLHGLSAGFTAPADYLNKTQIQSHFLPRLFDFLVATQLAAATPFTAMIAQLAGLMTVEAYDADPAIYQVAHLRPVIHWNRISDLFTAPVSRIRAEYHWATPQFDADRLIDNLGALVALLGLPPLARPLPARVEAQLSGGVPPAPGAPELTQLFFSFVRGAEINGLDVGVSLYPLRAAAGGSPGLGISPYLRGTTDKTIALTDRLSVVFDASVDLNQGIAAQLRPGQPTTITVGLLAGALSTTTSDHATLHLTYTNPAGALGLLVIEGDNGITSQSVSFGGGVAVSGGVVTPIIEASISGGHLKLDPSQTDSFIAKVIPVNIDVDFDFGVGWSGTNGFFFRGSASPAVTIGLHESLGPFTVDTLHAGLDTGQPGVLSLELSLSGKGGLGPFTVTVDRIGIRAAVAFHTGNLGPIDLDIEFKPPNGLGMELDAGLIAGGGYLSIDSAKHRYAGILDCSIADIVQVKVIGVLDTVLPDGTPEYSLLLVITTDFPPIQLGFGFTLNGVGGIGGVNRTLATNALRAGLRAHHLDSVLFPQDPIENAPQIISDLASYFPPADGRYVFGPMFELGWGTPTLITASVGVILEIPDPVTIAILGQIKLALPTADVGLIELNIDVLGIIDFGAHLLTIQGSMYDSRVLIYSVSGDMGLMIAWGANPNFAFSVGGLNPRFQPPPNFPQLARCCVAIGLGDNPRLSANSYFAVTSNSTQFGANVDLYASAGGFAIHGWVGFDALFIFAPFSFIIDFSAGFDVSFEGDSLAGIHVDGTLAGPHPWHVHGDASFHILFIDISASVDLSWGDRDAVALPPVTVVPELQKALANPQSWSTKLPSDATQAVSLRPRPPGDKTLIVHPAGTLEVRQKVVPLGQTITKFGNAAPADGNLFTISAVAVNAKTETQYWLTDMFAIGQYTDLTNDQKLTAPSYQPFNSGVAIGSSDVVTSRDVQCVVAYQDGYIDGDDTGMRVRQTYVVPIEIVLAYARLGAGFVSAARTKGSTAFTPPGTVSTVSCSELGYVIASTNDLSVRSDIVAAAVSHYEAHSALAAHLAANPADRGLLQVVTVSEVAA